MTDDVSRPAVGVPLHGPVGRLVVMRDPIAEALDDMAALGQHWARNRANGRMPAGIRAAMLLVAREALGAPVTDEALRLAVARTRDDLGPTGDNYPAVRKLLAFAEQAIAAERVTPNVQAHLTARQGGSGAARS